MENNIIIKNSEIIFEQECTFNKVKILQLIIKKEDFLKEQCKYFIKQ